jgi:cytochrome c oxidase subunit II
MGRALAGAALLLLTGCEGFQTALGGEGADSAEFVRLFAIFVIVCAVM